MMNCKQILLQFGSFEIHFIKIELSFMILRKISKNLVHFSQFRDISTRKNIMNIVKLYDTFVT